MIQLTAVTKTYKSGRRTVKALDDVSFSLESGAFASIIGKSGSGKSTLLNCIGGLEPVDQGEIACFRTSLTSLGARELSLFQRRHMGFVFQRGNLLSYLTVEENIGFPLALNRVTGRDQSERVKELLEKISLETAAAAMPHELSTGESQRVAAARAIAHNPKMLLADEPTANLDTTTGKRMVELIRKLGHEHGCTVIMATHDLEIIENTDAVISLKDGRVHIEERRE